MPNKQSSVPSGLPPYVIPDCLGVNIHFTGREQAQVDQIARAGFKFTRMDFFWGRIEKTKGEYDFVPYDELVETLASRDIRTIFILDYDNQFYDGGVSPHTDDGRSAFAAFARAAAAHFQGKGILWEIWNEPNLTQFWHPAAKVEDYVKLAKVVYPALKEGDPDCTVLAPALSGWDHDFIERCFQLGLLECTDVVSLHPYGARIPDDAARHFSFVRKLIRRYAPKGREYPIISGEWGYSASQGLSVEKQGEFLARELLGNTMSGCRLSIWYDWHDDGSDPNEPEHHFGTVYPDFTEKPAYIAMRTLANELRGYTFAARLALDSEEDYLALFKNGDSYRLAAWTISDAHEVLIPFDVPSAEIVSISGDRKRVDATDGMLKLELTGAVQYIEPMGESKRLALESAFNVTAVAVARSGYVTAEIEARLGSAHGGGELIITGDGLHPTRVDVPAGAEKIEARGYYVTTSAQQEFIKALLTLKGQEYPFVRVIEIDNTACPSIEVLSPGNDELIIAVNRPMVGAGGTFSGSLSVINQGGISTAIDMAGFELRPGEDRAVVRFRMIHPPRGIFSFGCTLTSPTGDVILRNPVRHYSMVETFAAGPVGNEITKYEIDIKGDGTVRAEVKLTYAGAPEEAPNPICARLDYDFDAGHRYVRIKPHSRLPIEGKPTSAKVWVHGNNGDGAARCLIVGSDNQTFQPDYGALLSFTGWRCLTAPLTGERAGHWGGPNDGVLRYPISWDTIFLFDNMGKRKTSGTIYVGSIVLCYD